MGTSKFTEINVERDVERERKQDGTWERERELWKAH